MLQGIKVTRTTIKTNAIIIKFQENISTELQSKTRPQKQFVTQLYSIKEFQYKLEVKRK